MLMALAYFCVAFPMPDLKTLLDMPRTIGNRTAPKDLPAPVTTACIPLTALPLASQVLVEIAAESFIGLDMAVDRLNAHRNF